MKKRIKLGLLSVAIVVGCFFMPAIESQAQESGPVKFQYGGDMKIKQEEGTHWLYTYCNKYQGDTCTSPDGAVRVEISPLAAKLLGLIINRT